MPTAAQPQNADPSPLGNGEQTVHLHCTAAKHGFDHYYRRVYGCSRIFIDRVKVDAARRGDPVKLTRNEKRVVVCLLTEEGKSQAEIARLLRISQRSAARQRQHIRNEGIVLGSRKLPVAAAAPPPSADEHETRTA